MAEELRIADRPELVDPILIAAFRGWNDGGQGASLAAGYLAKTWRAARFAEIDPEGFYDFQATRPHVQLVEGTTRRIDWPDNAFYHARIPGLRRDAVLLLGVEPNLRWRAFTNLIVDLAGELEVKLVVTLGSLLADVPHTRPAPVTGSATDPELISALGLQTSRYEGPTGIVGVLHDCCKSAGVASASLWAAVPHYVSLAPSPRAALALCQRLADLVGGSIDTGELETAAETYTEQVSGAVAGDAETAAYVEELEQRSDTIEDIDVPSGDTIAAELTRYLRERETGNGGADQGPTGGH
jgi:proteasome assembly chaperone (PAC2) family protein